MELTYIILLKNLETGEFQDLDYRYITKPDENGDAAVAYAQTLDLPEGHIFEVNLLSSRAL